jgi:hypothetical protein
MDMIVNFLEDFQASDETGTAVAHEYLEAAQKASRSLVPVYITCDVEENVRRVDSVERVLSGKKKMLQPEGLRDWIGRTNFLNFQPAKGYLLIQLCYRQESRQGLILNMSENKLNLNNHLMLCG